MSLEIYINPIPIEYRNKVRRTGDGYYYGDTKIAGWGASTGQIRRAANEHEYKLAVRETKEVIEYEAKRKKEMLKQQLEIAEKQKRQIQTQANQARASARHLKGDSKYDHISEKIGQKIDDLTEKSLQEINKEISSLHERIEKIGKIEDQAKRSQDLNELRKMAGDIRYTSSRARIDADDDYRVVREAIKKAEIVIKKIDECYATLDQIDGEITAPFRHRLDKIVEGLDPFDPSFDKVQDELNKITNELADVLEDKKIAAKISDDAEKVKNIINSLREFGHSFESFNNVDHDENYMMYRQQIAKDVQNLDEVRSTEILNKINNIIEEVKKLDMEEKDRTAYQTLMTYHDELVKLQEESVRYNNLEDKYNTVLNSVNEIRNRLNEEPHAQEFDVDKAEDQIRALNKEYVEFKKKERMRKYRDTCEFVRNEHAEKGYTLLKRETVLEDSEDEKRLGYTKLVFIDKNNPEVVKVFYILRTGEVYSETMVAVYDIQGQRYSAEITDEIMEEIHGTCKKSKMSEGEYEELKKEEVEYYQLSRETSEELNEEVKVVDTKTGKAKEKEGVTIVVTERRARTDEQRINEIKRRAIKK